MNSKTTRRSLIGIIGSVSITGCLGSSTTGKLAWENEDEFPNDENRNRQCEIRNLSSITQEIEGYGGTKGYQPIAHSIHGRKDIHGTNQHVEIEIEAEKEIDLYVTNTKNAATSHTAQNTNETENTSTDTNDKLGFNEIESHTATGITEHSDLIQIPDDETYTILLLPHEKPMTEPITATLNMNCSYYLPYEEHKKLQE